MDASDEEDRIVDDYGRDFIARRHRFPANGSGFLLAPVLWFAWFLGIYAVQGMGCATGLDNARLAGIDVLRLLLAALTVATLLVILLSGLWSFRAWRRLLEELEHEEHRTRGSAAFLSWGALLHAGLFLVATLWTGLPILMLDACRMTGTAGG